MSRFFFKVAHGAVYLAIILISELKYANPLSSIEDAQNFKMIPIWNEDGLSARDVVGPNEYYTEKEHSIMHLREGYEKYGSYRENARLRCELYVELNSRETENFKDGMEIEFAKANDETVFVGSETGDIIGTFRQPHSAGCKGHMASQIPQLLDMQFKYFHVNNGQISFMNDKGRKQTFVAGASVSRLKHMMWDEKKYPFDRLAKLVNHRDLKIEYALEDEVHEKYHIFFDDFERSADVGKLPCDFIVGNKTLVYYSFDLPMRKCRGDALLSRTVINSQAMYLKWVPETQKYTLQRVGAFLERQFHRMRSMVPFVYGSIWR